VPVEKVEVAMVDATTSHGRDKVEGNRRRTQIDTAFARLKESPATQGELVEAISKEFPSNKGTRAYDLLRGLAKKNLVEKQEGGRFKLLPDALQHLKEAGALVEEAHIKGF
jgi:galactokinase